MTTHYISAATLRQILRVNLTGMLRRAANIRLVALSDSRMSRNSRVTSLVWLESPQP